MSDVFDQHADSYSEIIDKSLGRFGANHDFFAAHKAKLLDSILRREGFRPQECRLVDIGCGTGMLHGHILGRFAAIEGIDTSKESVRIAAERYPVGRYCSYSGGRLPYADGAFDIALAVTVFHHVAPPERPMLVQEILRVLRPGGLALTIEHNPYNPLTRHIVNTCELDKDAILLKPAELRDLFTSAGGQSVYTRTVLTVPPITALMFRVDDLFGRLPLGAQYYLVARAPGVAA